jgi:hypothetical protein
VTLASPSDLPTFVIVQTAPTHGRINVFANLQAAMMEIDQAFARTLYSRSRGTGHFDNA